MKRIKKLLSVFICVILVTTATPFMNLFTATAENTEGFYTYEVINEEAIITGFDNSFSGDLTIPETLGGYPVTRIENYVFYGCKLTNISIPDSVTSIGYYAFNSCRYYRDESNWENDVLYIDNHLIEVRTSVSGEFNVKEGTKTIADYAFYDCDGITKVIMPDSLKSIGNAAFEDCYTIESVSMPNTVKSIGDFAFLACFSLKEVQIPDSVEKIGDFAFQYCENLTTATLGNNLKVIGNSAFQYCEKLQSVSIPASVEKIGDFAFQYCYILKGINVAEENDNYCSSGGALFDKDMTTLIQYPAGLESLSYTVPESIAYINSYAFQYNNSLESVIIPDNVKEIGYRAFYSCVGLESVTLGNGITAIENSTFLSCVKLKAISIPESVKSLGDSAFSDCVSLESISLPNGLTKIGGYAFLGCVVLSKITIPETVTNIGYSAFKDSGYYKNESNWENDFLYIGEYLVNTKANITGKYEIKEGTKYIADSAFYSRTGLVEITVPSSLVSIGNNAFYRCNALAFVNFRGDEHEWNNIIFGNNNKLLTNADLSFNYIEYPKGDINQNNLIDICDLLQLKITLLSVDVEFNRSCDVNEDYTLNSLDYTSLRKILFKSF